ncbi:MAG: hypothetical protein NE328_15705 [Lentisphaeraceae bacterium]|nr:hypothetical protein [Lentisphaeraceae bacterium]
MIRFFALIFLLCQALQVKAEKQYKRSFPILELALEIAENETGEALFPSIDMIKVPEKFKPAFKAYLKKHVHDYSGKTLIEIDEKKKLVHVTSNLKTMYQVMNLIGDHYTQAAQLKFHFSVIEVSDISEILKMNPLKVKPEAIRSLPENQRKIISEHDVFTQNGNTGFIKAGGNIIEITPLVDPDGCSIEVEMRCVLKGKYTYMHDTRFKCLDRSEMIFQIQSKDNKKRSNRFLLVSTTLFDYDLKPLGRFTKKEVETVRKQIMESHELQGKMFTRFYKIFVGTGSGGEDEQVENKPDFKGYFLQRGIPFTEEETVTFVLGAMRLVIKAKESTHQKIEKHLRLVGIETPQRKIVLRVYEADNETFEKLKGSKTTFLDMGKLKNLKVLDNFELLAVSGKTGVVTESDLSEQIHTVYFDITSQSNLTNTESEIGFNLYYQKNGISAELQRQFSIKNGDFSIFELQSTKNITFFAAVYADKFIAESDYWYRR